MLEWDEKKAQLNFKKHGVSFFEAATCFEDRDILMLHDISHSKEEDRYISIARAHSGRIISMVFTMRRDGYGKKKIYRIISARLASQKERKKYPR